MTAEYVLRKRGYFYRADAMGFTKYLLEAGLFTVERARNEMYNDDAVTSHRFSEFIASPRPISDAEAEAGGKALRERAGSITRKWLDVPKAERRKWVDTARIVISAARSAI